MPNKNKIRGNNFERFLVEKAKEQGLTARRAWGSNGEAMGEVKEVDLMVEQWRIQAKKRKKLPAYLAIDEGVDAVVFSQDRTPPLVLIPYSKFLELIKPKHV